MATKQETKTKTAPRFVEQEVDALTGTVKGKRFSVKLDEIHKDDVWSPNILPMLQRDGIGKVSLREGFTAFIFADGSKSTVHFTAKQGNLQASKFTIEALEEEDV